MTKQEFLAELRKGLSGLPQQDIEEWLAFYSEMIDDRMEEGLSEFEAVDAIGSVREVVSQILEETPLTKLVKEKVKPNRSFRLWEVILLILGSPLWLSLLIAAVSVILAAYIMIWTVVAVMWSVEAVLAVCSLGGIAAAVIFIVQGNGISGAAMLGAGMCCAGLSIFFVFVCKEAAKGMFLLSKKIVLGIKSLFVGKEAMR